MDGVRGTRSANRWLYKLVVRTRKVRSSPLTLQTRLISYRLINRLEADVRDLLFVLSQKSIGSRIRAWTNSFRIKRLSSQAQLLRIALPVSGLFGLSTNALNSYLAHRSNEQRAHRSTKETITDRRPGLSGEVVQVESGVHAVD